MVSRADIAAGKGSGTTTSKHEVITIDAPHITYDSEGGIITCTACTYYTCCTFIWALALAAFGMSVFAVYKINTM